jgi:acetyltransferase-like isoleucine patch superfamily enzyme
VDFDIYGVLLVGSNVRLADGASIEVGPQATLEIGNDVFVGRHTVVAASEFVRLGDGVLVAEHCSVRDGDHAALAEERRTETAMRTSAVSVGDNAWIAAGCRILRGADIGVGAVVAANSVVRSAVPPHSLVAGAPARVVRKPPSAPDQNS